MAWIMLLLNSQGYAEMKPPKIIQNSPSYHYILFDMDTVLERKYQGFQDIENEVPVNPQTTYHAFSITKTFTAVAVMQLVEKELIHLDDPIDSHIHSYHFSKPITIRQLLCHQSGLANPIPMKWIHLKEDGQDFNFSSFADSVIMHYLSNTTEPGSKYKYSNLNYLVLGRLIEYITGAEYTEYIDQHIIRKLELENIMGFEAAEGTYAVGYHKNNYLQKMILSLVLDKPKYLYTVNDEFLGFKPFKVNGSSYGGLVCTPDGLMEYARSLMKKDSPLLKPETLTAMFTEQKTSHGKASSMSLGWFTGSLQDIDYLHHSGGGGGYYAELRIYPDLGLGSVVMLNHSGMMDLRILDSMDESLLASLKNR